MNLKLLKKKSKEWSGLFAILAFFVAVSSMITSCSQTSKSNDIAASAELIAKQSNRIAEEANRLSIENAGWQKNS